jgi:hypothetical protein
MANSRTARTRSIAPILFIVSGVLILLELLLAHFAANALDIWLVFIAYAALAVAFLVLFLRGLGDLVARIAFIVAAVGWAILAIATVASVGGLLTFGIIIALIGTVVAGIIVFARDLFWRGASIAFLVAAIVAGLLLLSEIGTFMPATFVTVLEVIFGIMLIATGVLTGRRR